MVSDMDVKTVSVIGAGAMGHGIAQVFAQAGFDVTLMDIKPELVQRGFDNIKRFLQGSIERKRITAEDAATILGRIKMSTDLAEAGGNADLVFEAIIEDMDIKKDIFKRLDKVAPAHTIFASNTSYQSVTELASVTARPQKFVGMHWFNPPYAMRGVELVTTDKTLPEVVEMMVALAKKLGKEPAVCKDATGFIANRVLQVWRAEAFKLYDDGAASFQDIDKALKAACGFRRGPFAPVDLTGVEICLKGSETFYTELKREIFRPSTALVQKVRAGDYGRKTGQGFYSYKDKSP